MLDYISLWRHQSCQFLQSVYLGGHGNCYTTCTSYPGNCVVPPNLEVIIPCYFPGGDGDTDSPIPRTVPDAVDQLDEEFPFQTDSTNIASASDPARSPNNSRNSADYHNPAYNTLRPPFTASPTALTVKPVEPIETDVYKSDSQPGFRVISQSSSPSSSTSSLDCNYNAYYEKDQKIPRIASINHIAA